MLRRRAELLRRTRGFFESRGFLEVETPLLSSDVVVDRHIEPFRVGNDLWLQTSPEFAMKRLLAAGAEAIFQVTRAFRREEQGPLHNREFTIVEWYRRGDDAEAGMQTLSDLSESLLGWGPATGITYREAFSKYAGVDPFLDSNEQLQTAAQDLGLQSPDGFSLADRDGWLDLLLVEKVAPNLGTRAPVILHDYPPSQAALAKIREGEFPVAERFELFARGIELANGYHELLDPQVLRTRIARQNELRLADGRGRLPAESRLLAAMEFGLPACAGVALGFDRVVMLAAGACDLSEVIPFPGDRA